PDPRGLVAPEPAGARAMSDAPAAPAAPTPAVPADGFRTFLVLWASQSVSLIGSSLTYFPVNIWLTPVRFPRIEQKPQLAIALSLTTLSFFTPSILAGPIAGAWADRHDRARTMFAMNLAAGLLTALFMGLLVSGALEVWML